MNKVYKFVNTVCLGTILTLSGSVSLAASNDGSSGSMMNGGMMRGSGNYSAGCSGMGMMGPGMGPGMGMMGSGMGMMGSGMGQGMGMMNLTDKQRSKLRSMQREQRKSQWALRGKMMDEMDKLQDLYDKETLDAKAITKVHERMFALKKQMIEQQVTNHNKMRSMMTDKQRNEMRELRRRGMGMMN